VLHFKKFQKGGVKMEVKERLLVIFVSRGDFERAKKVAETLSAELIKRSKELKKNLEKCLENYVEEGWPKGAIETAKLLGRELTPQELGKIAKRCIENEWPYRAIEVAELLVKLKRTQEVEEILVKFTEKGWLSEAKKVASLLPEPKRTEYLNIFS
jgi:SOS response regulatory protein OraA/RecX